MRTGFFMRLAMGVGLTVAVTAILALAPLADVSSHRLSTPAADMSIFEQQSLLPYSLQRAIMPIDLHNPIITKEAVSEKTSTLLWEGWIPLSSNGGSTAENIALAAEAIDMTIVHPNETFSFNNIVGIRTEEKGYQAGPMYSAGEKVMGVGGGICMVSTILYNGALETGLRIIERHPHSGPVSYAEPGRDAAVSFGLADLRFKNDTGNALLIRASAEGDELSLRIYGKKIPGRSVELVAKDYEELPYKIFEKEDKAVPEGKVEVKQKARPGFSVTIVRLIKQNGKLLNREVLNHDTILPADKIVLIPPGSKEPTGVACQSPVTGPTLSAGDENSISPQPSGPAVEAPGKNEDQPEVSR